MATRIEVLANHPVYLFWAGDGVMNDANAIFYVKRNGQSYFGGSLTVGFLRVQVSNNVPTSNPEVETGEFDTNGASKQVTVSFTYNNNSSGTGTKPSVPSQVYGTITLYRRVGGGSWSQVGSTAPITGSASSDQIGGDWEASVDASGTLNTTDSNSSAGPFEYKAVVSSTGFPYSLPGSGMGHQSLTLISTEY